MGFGILFIGFLLTVNIPYHAYTDLFATALMLYALSMLFPHAKGFRFAFRFGVPLAAVNLVSFVLALCTLLHLFTVPETLVSIMACAGILLRAVFFWFLFAGIEEVTCETELPKVRAHAMRSRFLTPVFAIVGLVLEMGVIEKASYFMLYCMMGYIIFGVIYAILNAKTVYECYILICYEGEESMDRRPSRFGFVNKVNKLSDALDERTARRRSEERAQREAKKKEAAERASQKRNKKK